MEFKTSALEAACDRLASRDIAVDCADMEVAIMAFIEAGGLVSGDNGVPAAVLHPVDAAIAELKDVKALVEADVSLALESENDWKTLFDRVFCKSDMGYSARAVKALSGIGWSFPGYYDPDTSYREDAQAWIAAFTEVFSELERFDIKRGGVSRD